MRGLETHLGRLIAARIEATGPISLAEYMSDCLSHPEHGYYMTRDPLGAAGDFTTAPEISQMFGELLGLALTQAWIDQGQPKQIVLAELGPGRGTLMADMLRAMAVVPGLVPAARVVLVETSPALRAAQQRTLAGRRIDWITRVEDLPDGPFYLVANEFFDALPIRQFRKARGGWSETQVGLGPAGLRFGVTPPAPVAALSGRIADVPEGGIVEVCPAASAIGAEIGRRVAAFGGAAIVVDYGGWRSLGDTVQAMRHHAPADPLSTPGEADLTAHVDFEALAGALAAGGAAVTAMVTQGALLQRLGIESRAERLGRKLEGAALETHRAALRRLTHPDEMGDLFKAVACHPAGAPPPPGF